MKYNVTAWASECCSEQVLTMQFEPGVVFSPIDANYLLPFRPERSLVRTHMHTESKVVVLQQYIVRAGMFCALE